MSHEERLPFKVNRNDARSLLDQVSDGLRDAIMCGHWKSGDEIPSSRELVDLLGVSRIVTKAALARIAAEGYILSRTGLKPVVRDRNDKQWRGHVLVVCPGGDENYVETVLASALRDRLAAADYLVTPINVPYAQAGKTLVNISRSRSDEFDFSRLDVALAQTVDLVVAVSPRLPVLAYLAKQKVPYVVFDGRSKVAPSAAGHTRFDMNLAMEDFAAACRANGVKEVVQLQFWPSEGDVTTAMRKAGVRVRKVTVDVDESDGALFGIKRAGMEVIVKMLSKGVPPRDTVLFANDDYLAGGALMAIADAGLKAPTDIRFVTFANKRLGPVYPRELTRMEFDAYHAGEVLSAAVLEYLKTGVYPKNSVVGPVWVAGKTMGSGE